MFTIFSSQKPQIPEILSFGRGAAGKFLCIIVARQGLAALHGTGSIGDGRDTDSHPTHSKASVTAPSSENESGHPPP